MGECCLLCPKWQRVGAGVGAGVELSTEVKMWVGLGYLACAQTRCMECKQVYKVCT